MSLNVLRKVKVSECIFSGIRMPKMLRDTGDGVEDTLGTSLQVTEYVSYIFYLDEKAPVYHYTVFFDTEANMISVKVLEQIVGISV